MYVKYLWDDRNRYVLKIQKEYCDAVRVNVRKGVIKIVYRVVAQKAKCTVVG